MKYHIIYDYIDNDDIYFDLKEGLVPPMDVNYNVLGLKKYRIFDYGEPVKVIYYAGMDDNGNYIYPVVEENRTYVRNEAGFVLRREMDIYWYFNDGTKDEENIKHTVKYYTAKEQFVEIKRKRTNIIDECGTNIVGFIQMINQCSLPEAILKFQKGVAILQPYIDLYIMLGVDDLAIQVRDRIDKDLSFLDYDVSSFLGLSGFYDIRHFIIEHCLKSGYVFGSSSSSSSSLSSSDLLSSSSSSSLSSS